MLSIQLAICYFVTIQFSTVLHSHEVLALLHDKEVPSIFGGVAPLPNSLTWLRLSSPKKSGTTSFRAMCEAKDSGVEALALSLWPNKLFTSTFTDLLSKL